MWEKQRTDDVNIGGTSYVTVDVLRITRVNTGVGLLTVFQNEATDSRVNVISRTMTIRHL